MAASVAGSIWNLPFSRSTAAHSVWSPHCPTRTHFSPMSKIRPNDSSTVLAVFCQPRKTSLTLTAAPRLFRATLCPCPSMTSMPDRRAL